MLSFMVCSVGRCRRRRAKALVENQALSAPGGRSFKQHVISGK
jgi:hypothetical protein